MQKLDMQTPDLTNANIDKIAKLFPQVITEKEDEEGTIVKAIDFDLLRQELSKELVEDSDERYRLDRPGKKASILKANTPIDKTLRPDRESSVNFDTTENLYLEGDNFEILKILQESYLGKIKMIYIDPPYNTGQDFVYKDNFKKSKDDYEEDLGVEDEEGVKLFKNTDTNGRFHSDWLSMMYERLVVARDLLKDDGAIFMSIDDNEVHNLKKVADEVFGEENYLNQISLLTKVSAGASGGGEDKKLKKNIEYVLVYMKKVDYFQQIQPIYKETELMNYIDMMKLDGKSFKYTNILYKQENIMPFKVIKDGSGLDIEIKKVNNYEIKTVKQISEIENISIKDVYNKYYDKVMTTTNAQTSIRQRVWDATDSDNTMYIASYVPKSGKNKGMKTELILMGKQKVLVIRLKDTTVKINNKIYKREKVGTFRDGYSWINVSKEGNVKFLNGKKPINLMENLFKLVESERKDDIIMDFFSGSGSTAHSIMNLNIRDGGKRKFIMVQLPERITEKSEEFKDGFNSVTELGKERIRRAGKKILEDNKDKEGIEKLDTGFRVYKADSTNMKEVFYHPSQIKQGQLDGLISNIKDDRTPEDLLTQVMLDLGLTLDLPMEEKTIKSNKVFFVAGNSLVACFDDDIDFEIVDEIAKIEPLKIVFRDSCFKDDKDRINVENRIKRLSPESVVSVI